MLNNVHQSIKYRNDETLRSRNGSSRDKIQQVNKQGIVTDTFLINKERENSVFRDTPLPEDLRKYYNSSAENNRENARSSGKAENDPIEKHFYSMVGVPLGVLGTVALATGIASRIVKRKFAPEVIEKASENGAVSKITRGITKLFTDKEKGPIVPRQININSPEGFATYEALRDPSLKNLLGAAAILTYSTTALVMRNTVDGLKDIWVKKNEADIQRNFQENMIDIETRSFSGKKQTVRYLLDKNTKELDRINKEKNISFQGNKKDKEEKETLISGMNPVHLLAGAATIGGSILLMRKTVKNIREIGETIKKVVEKTSATMGEKKGSSWSEANAIYGDKSGKPTVFGFLNDEHGHIYNMFVTPGKFTGKLAGFVSGVAGLGYVGSKFVEGNKEIQVKKANAKIDLDLHDKLVPVELKNFKKKKEVAVKPLFDDYKNYTDKHSEDSAGIKSKYNSIMDEIKNGPPFIYD